MPLTGGNVGGVHDQAEEDYYASAMAGIHPRMGGAEADLSFTRNISIGIPTLILKMVRTASGIDSLQSTENKRLTCSTPNASGGCHNEPGSRRATSRWTSRMCPPSFRRPMLRPRTPCATAVHFYWSPYTSGDDLTGKTRYRRWSKQLNEFAATQRHHGCGQSDLRRSGNTRSQGAQALRCGAGAGQYRLFPRQDRRRNASNSISRAELKKARMC